MSEPRRWSGGAARVAGERPLGDGRRRHDALPLAFLVVVDLDPEIGGDVDAVGGLQQGERQVALAGRRPQGRGDVASSEEQTPELQSLITNQYSVYCLTQKKHTNS